MKIERLKIMLRMNIGCTSGIEMYFIPFTNNNSKLQTPNSKLKTPLTTENNSTLQTPHSKLNNASHH